MGGSMSKEWLDDSGRFLFGKHEGETLERVAKEDLGYLRWIIETVDNIDEYDREAIEAVLRLKRRW
jgi:hypothetical protein